MYKDCLGETEKSTTVARQDQQFRSSSPLCHRKHIICVDLLKILSKCEQVFLMIVPDSHLLHALSQSQWSEDLLDVHPDESNRWSGGNGTGCCTH